MIKIEKMDNFTKKKKYPPTVPQWQAISLTGADVLVAAAAGSGKTEVLSERISRKVALDRWDIDKMLVLTFTTAAAKNMLVRIENKISERLLSSNSEEDLVFLRKQRMLMNDAYVSTIDSFCLSVLKKFYYLVEEDIKGEKKYLSPNFSVLPNSKDLLKEAADEILEYYAKEERTNSDILFTVLGDKNSIISSLSDTYYKLLSIPNFEKYLSEEFLKNNEELLNEFDFSNFDIVSDFNNVESLTSYGDLELAKRFAEYVSEFVKSSKEQDSIELALSASTLDEDKKEKIKKYFEEKIITLFKSKVETQTDLAGFIEILDKELEKEGSIFDAGSLSVIHNELKNYSGIFEIARKINDFAEVYKNTLIKLHEEFISKKRANNFLDFSDLNHLAIKALTKEENGEIVLSEAAEYYRNHFLEIYVDEYQDNNNLQEYILNLIKGNNVHFFRVGDVKQAIYGFRGSNPDLFEEKYNNYEKLNIADYSVDKDYEFKTNANGICVVLKENFRSDENILKSSNYVFNRLMGNKNSGVSYDEESALYYPKVKEKNVEIIPTKIINGQVNYFTNDYADKKEYRTQSIENIAYEILRGVKNGKEYSDYAILVRNSTKMNSYKEIFAKYNIPLFFKEKVGFTTSNCFNLLYNLLRFLDNTTREANLIAILHSEVFNYSNDEFLRLSLNSGKTLFEKIENSSEVKDKNTVGLLKKWLNFSLNNSLIALVERISTDVDFKNYLVTVGTSDEEVDYYENFLDVVRNYENLDNKLSGFVEYLKNIKEDEVFETKKRTPNNSVTLSTIHISKGLEYKEVFVAELDTTFSKRGYSGEVLFTENFGFSISVENISQKYNISLEKNEYLDSLYKLNSILIKLREREEEVRNLYVALTRAEKSLYLVSPNGVELNSEEVDKNIYQALMEEDSFEKILTNVFSNYGEFSVENEDGALIDKYKLEEEIEEDEEFDFVFDLEDFYNKFSAKNNISASDETTLSSKNKIFPAKTSYSALKKINNNTTKQKQKEKTNSYLNLSTLSKVSSSSKAIMRGNIVHKLFERIVNDVRRGEVISDVEEYLSSLVKTELLIKNIKERRILEMSEYELIDNADDKDKINKFISSELITLIKEVQSCQTEVAFTTTKEAKELYKESASSSEVILQGVVDLLVIVDEETAFIVDYKTDNVGGKNAEQTLITRHSEQLRIYKEAVEDYYKLNNVKTYVYSYVLSKLIQVN